jgi:hypothetical protein
METGHGGLRNAGVVIAIAGLLLACAVSAKVVAKAKPPAGSPDWVGITERRYSQLRSVLPKRGIACFVGGSELSRNDFLAELFIAQYSVNPVLVSAAANCNNEAAADSCSMQDPVTFSTAARPCEDVILYSPSGALKLNSGFTAVEDFGGGLALFRRTHR